MHSPRFAFVQSAARGRASRFFLPVLASVLAGAPSFGRAAESAAPAAPAAAPAIAVAALNRGTPVDFEMEILPIFKNNCLACHGQKKPKGGLILETPQTILKGGDSGPAILPGKGGQSYLVQVASHQVEDTVMPPKGNKVKASDLTPEELGLIKLWIDQGAKGEVRGAGPIQWKAMPPVLNAIHAVAVTDDGQYAACDRANQIYIYHLPTRRLMARLQDPELARSGLYGKEGAAHRDFVNALAFNPAGDLLASGGYREVKLWRRVKSEPRLHLASADRKSVRALAASPDGKWIATGGADAVVKLWNTGDGKLAKELAGATNGVTALEFSPDGKTLAGGAGDKSVLVWDLSEGHRLARLVSPAEVNALTWADQGKLLVAGCADKIIRVWPFPVPTDATTVKAREWTGHDGSVTALATVDAAGKQVLSGSADGSVRLWNADSGKVIRQMNQGGPVAAVAARADGKRFASAGLNRAAKLWKADDGKQVAELKGDRYKVEEMASKDRQKSLATAEVAFRKSDLEAMDKEHKSESERVAKAEKAFEPADKAYAEKKKTREDALQAKAAAEKSLADLRSDIQRVTEAFEKANLAAKEAETEAKAMIEKATAIKGAAEKALQAKLEAESFLAQAQSLAERARAGAGISSLTAEEKALADRRAADGEAVAAKAKALAESAATEAESKSKAALQTRPLADKAIEALTAKAFAAGQAKVDFDKVTHGAQDKLKAGTNTVNEAAKKVTEAEKAFTTAEQERSRADTELQLAKKAEAQAAQAVQTAQTSLKTAQEREKTALADLESAKKAAAESELPVRSVAFSPDGLALVTAGDDASIHTWSAENGSAIEVYSAPKAPVQALDFTPSGELVAGMADASASVLRLEEKWVLERTIGTGDETSPLADRVNALAFRPDGQWIATGGGQPSRNGEIKIWRVADGKLVKDWPNVHSDAVLSLDFSPDGKYLASGATDKFAKVVDVETGEVVKTFEGHTHHVLGVSWKGDGRIVATSGADNVVKVWDFFKGERKANVQGFDKQVTSIHFIGTSDRAVVSAGDNKVRIIKENGDQVRTFSGVHEFQHAAAATPDGNIVIAGGEDSVLRIWNGNSGDVLADFKSTENP
jgi:WD40 repeat protein